MKHDFSEPEEGLLPRAVILTALPLEREAVCRHLSDLREDEHPEGTIYLRGCFRGVGTTWEVCVVEVGPGNVRAALEAERAIGHFSPKVALFVGVAGGLKDVAIGDVVAATKVYGYESGAAKTAFEPRPEFGAATYPMEQRARFEAGSGGWLDRLGPVGDPAPKVFVGPIAAGEKVLKSKRSALYKYLRSNCGDALAVEMEGIGFLTAVRANHAVQALVVRGISDLIRGKAAADAAGSQEQAARNASAFAFEILSKLKVQSPPKPKARPVSTARVSGDEVGAELPDASALALFQPKDRNPFLIRVRSWKVGEVHTLVLAPRSPAGSDLLIDLARPSAQPVGMACGGTALMARVVDVERRSDDDGGELVRLTVRAEDMDFGVGASEARHPGYRPERIAEMRARRILLDERLDDTPSTDAERLTSMIVEDLIQGSNPALQVTKSPIPEVFALTKDDPSFFLEVARLFAVLTLKLTGTVETIDELEMEFVTESELTVRFEGRRPRVLPNKEPHVIRVEGTCQLEAAETVDRIPVASSNLRAIGYNAKTRTLEVEFLNGSLYQYYEVPEYHYSGLMNAVSHGRYLDAYIKKASYNYRQLR